MTGTVAAGDYLVRGTALAVERAVGALVMAPVNKVSLQRGGHRFPGEAEMLAHLTGVPDVLMLHLGEGYRMARVTVHVALRASTVWLVYNCRKVTDAEAPKRWADLLDPKWKGRIALLLE